MAVGLTLLVAAAFLLYSRGFLRFNYPSLAQYPIRGIDVSHHQGVIDWSAVRAEGFEFAFIKASEGTDHVDRAFARNWDGARVAGIARGAYHFFTFCSPGRAQAQHFVSVVGAPFGELAPVADVEFAGNCTSWQSLEQIRTELRAFLTALEDASGRRPAVYFTRESHARLLAGALEDYATWPRSVFVAPTGERWSFWQFADNGRVAGIATLVDLDVFRGGRRELESLAPARDTLER
ncbi:MAG TPA: GH25 family lysozyme [Myxococcota bacterium]|nr:GH25 family lysozyme [Myxococcota bacterium]